MKAVTEVGFKLFNSHMVIVGNDQIINVYEDIELKFVPSHTEKRVIRIGLRETIILQCR